MCGKRFVQTPSYGSKHLDQKGGSLLVKNSSKYLANLWELIPMNLGMLYGTLNPPMCCEHFAKTPSYCSKHLDQKGGSLSVENSSKYMASLWELIPNNLGMISGTLNPPMCGEYFARTHSYCSSTLTKKVEA